MPKASHWFIGNQTAFCAPPLLPFAFAAEQGFDAFEFFPDRGPSGSGWAAADMPSGTRAVVRAKAADHGIRLSVHASLSADPTRRTGSAVLATDLAFAREIGARALILHLSPTDLSVFAKGVLALADTLADAGMILSIENTVAVAPEDFNTLFQRLGDLDSGRARHVGMCLDIGHANLFAGTHNDYLAYLDRLSPDIPIAHVHAHENWGDRDSHLTLFTGRAAEDSSGIEGLVRRLIERRFSGSVILEQWPRPSALLRTARDRLQSIVKSIASEERRPCAVGS